MKEVEWKFELNVDCAQSFEVSLHEESLFLWEDCNESFKCLGILLPLNRSTKQLDSFF